MVWTSSRVGVKSKVIGGSGVVFLGSHGVIGVEALKVESSATSVSGRLEKQCKVRSGNHSDCYIFRFSLKRCKRRFLLL